MNIRQVRSENQYNKLVKSRRDRDATLILFTSSYDRWGQDIIDFAKKQGEGVLHVVDSFETPHAFTSKESIKVTNVPTLVSLTKKARTIETRVSSIYSMLGDSSS